MLLCAGRSTPTQMNAFTIEAKAKAKDSAAPAVCTTKPFGQCAGMNFTAGAVGYNFSAKAEPFACCPEGQECLQFGPVWGMCMPSWAKPPPKASAESILATLNGSPEIAAALSELAAKAKPASKKEDKKEEKKEDKEDKKEDKKEDAKEEEAPEPCTTKPFGQCAGMNFTETKAERAAYNITEGAAVHPLACCPAGMSCMVFGPVWGMCMPAPG